MSAKPTEIKTLSQLEIDFEPGLTNRYPTLAGLIYNVVSEYGIQDMAELLGYGEDEDGRSRLSTFSRMISPHDRYSLPLDTFVRIIQVTRDKRPVYWLVEKLLNTKQARKQLAFGELAELFPRLQALVSEVEAEDAK